jgi:hypothetical protein
MPEQWRRASYVIDLARRDGFLCGLCRSPWRTLLLFRDQPGSPTDLALQRQGVPGEELNHPLFESDERSELTSLGTGSRSVDGGVL